MRVKGTVIRFIQGWEHVGGQIESESGERYKVTTSKDIHPDRIGRRFLIPGEPVEFEASNTIGKIAKNIKRIYADQNIDPATHRELCLVIDENMLMRQVGGRLATGLGDLDGIKPDSIVSCGVARSNGHSMWQATDVRFVADAEDQVDWNSEASLNA